MKNKFTILGCGSSLGAPWITDYWGNLKSSNKKNIRTRCCAHINYQNISILIDTSPDIKEQIKKNKIKDKEKIKFINDEYNLLKEQMSKKVKTDENLDRLFASLKDINSKLWVIEDDKRLCEKNSDFSEKFIKLSRDIHFLNDKRASIKLEINNHTGSKIKEIKEYTSY